jgi:hypothetical protein
MTPLWKKIIGKHETSSFGIEKAGKFMRAWVNFKPPYDNNGGNWCYYDDTSLKALKGLYKKINIWRKAKKK